MLGTTWYAVPLETKEHESLIRGCCRFLMTVVPTLYFRAGHPTRLANCHPQQ